MRREPVTGPMSRWAQWRWVLADVLAEADAPWFGSPQQLTPGSPQSAVPVEPDHKGTEGSSHWLYPGFDVTLFRDDAEGYFLNLESPQPCFWVMWRAPERDDGLALPQPQIVTLSYHDAGRWLDAQEQVDQVPAPPGVCQWLASFVELHYQPEPKRRKRPDSFQPLTDRFGQPARVRGWEPSGGGRGGAGHA